MARGCINVGVTPYVEVVDDLDEGSLPWIE